MRLNFLFVCVSLAIFSCNSDKEITRDSSNFPVLNKTTAAPYEIFLNTPPGTIIRVMNTSDGSIQTSTSDPTYRQLTANVSCESGPFNYNWYGKFDGTTNDNPKAIGQPGVEYKIYTDNSTNVLVYESFPNGSNPDIKVSYSGNEFDVICKGPDCIAYTEPNSIEITYPTTAVLKTTNYVDVTWAVVGVLSSAKIEYSVNNGAWTQIASGISHSFGEYIWNGATQVSTNYRIRVSDLTRPSINDVSAQFTVGPRVIINGPSSAAHSGESKSYSLSVTPSGSYVHNWYKKIGSGSYSSIGSGTSKTTAIYSPNTTLKVETYQNGTLIGVVTKEVWVGEEP
jgi:hypothetical protein